MALFDHDLKLHKSNSVHSKMLGYSMLELAEINHGDLIHPDEQDAFHDLLISVRNNQQLSIKRKRAMLHKSGHTVWVNETIYPATISSNEIEYHFLSLTEEIPCEQNNPQKQWLATEIIQTMSDGLIVTDSDFKIIQVNRAMSVITEFSANELLGELPKFLTSKDQNTAFFRNIRLRLKLSGSWQGELQHRRKGGEIVQLWLRINAIKDNDGKVTHYIGIFSDISLQVKLREDLRHLAHHDALTDLPNRLLFHDRLKMAIRHADRTEQGVALLFVDLNGFKQINDEHGHAAGDTILIEIAHRLKSAVRDEDTVARFGGDEFTIVFANASHQSDASRIAIKIMDSISDPITVQGEKLYVTASIGISLYPDDANSADELIMKADTAMYDIKESGCSNYLFFNQEL